MLVPVVGFDLDMTLVDSAAGIVAAVVHTGRRFGVEIAADDVAATLGLPLDQVFPPYLPDVPYEEALAVYRAHYLEHGVPASVALAGAAESVEAVRAAGGRTVVVSAKHGPVVSAVLEAVGISVDAVEGEAFGAAKGARLTRYGAHVYVGDHVGDVDGARAAGALAVGVPTGPTGADELAAAGADVVLADLAAFPSWFEDWLLDARLAALLADLSSRPGAVVAFSGGADSAFLLAAAVRALGPRRVVAATAVSGSLADGELAAASAFAAGLGVRHLTPPTRELARPGYAANGPDRCFHCKAELLDVLSALPSAVVPDGWVVATGTNADDVGAGFRPGIAAAAERGAVAPLAQAGLTKRQVRQASRAWGLRTWDKPQAACLSSRVAYGIAITPARLLRVDRAEAGLREALADAGVVVRDLRVRDLGDRARIEVDVAAAPLVAALPAALEAVRHVGFDLVEVDPQGFRSGSMNEALAPG